MEDSDFSMDHKFLSKHHKTLLNQLTGVLGQNACQNASCRARRSASNPKVFSTKQAIGCFFRGSLGAGGKLSGRLCILCRQPQLVRALRIQCQLGNDLSCRGVDAQVLWGQFPVLGKHLGGH